MSAFVRWLTDPRPGRGIYLASDPQGWQRIEYGELALAAGAVAAQLGAKGVGAGDVVCVTASTDHESIAALFGIWLAGATVCPLAPPVMQSEREYVDRTAAIFEQAAPTLTVTTEEFRPLIDEALARAAMPGPALVIGDPGRIEPAPRAHGEIALLQFTSGSSARPQGVRVSWGNLDANLAAIRRGIAFRDDDAVASWLPLYHDMGLIGCFYLAIAEQTDLWLMRPAQFIRDPARWLECFQPGRARLTAVPSFAFAYLARRVPPQRIASMDLSGWRCAAMGSEVIDVAALEAFAEHAAPAGFSRDVVVPWYGLAENTLAVTSAGLHGRVHAVRPDWARMRFGEPVRIEREGRYGDKELGPGSGWLLGHGRPAPGEGIDLWIVDEDGRTLPDGSLGEIVVSGTSVALGYQGDNTGRSTRFVGRMLYTGDAGFLYKGHLWVLGRMGESLTLRGRNVYVEDLDSKVAEAADLSRDRVATVGITTNGRAGVVVFAEARPGPWTEKVDRMLRGELGPEPDVTIVAGTRGLIKRTTSGKPRRRRMWQLLQDGELGRATVVRHAVVSGTRKMEASQ